MLDVDQSTQQGLAALTGCHNLVGYGTCVGPSKGCKAMSLTFLDWTHVGTTHCGPI